MTTYNLVADGTLTLFDRVFSDFADEDISTITFQNDIVAMKTGKNGNTIFSKNETGRNAAVVLRLIRGSSDDIFMQEKVAQIRQDFATAELAFGQFRLRIGNGEGDVRADVYTLSAGMVTRQIDAKENVSGDIQQGVSVYNIGFADAERTIQ